jgi:hypothetical protein
MNKKLFNASFLLCLIILLGINVIAQSYNPHSRSLKGLKSVGVVIVTVDPEIKRAGLTESHIRQSVKLQLRNASIHVYDYSPSMLNPLILHIKIDALKVKDKLYAVSIEVAYKQPVMLIRDKFTVGATTWSKEKMEVVELKDRLKISEGIEEIVAAFIGDYLAENPKDSKGN